MKKFFIGAALILTLLLLGTGVAHAEEFQLPPENRELLEQVNDILTKNGKQPLEIIVDGKNEYWGAEECYLKIDTNTKNIELKGVAPNLKKIL